MGGSVVVGCAESTLLAARSTHFAVASPCLAALDTAAVRGDTHTDYPEASKSPDR
ncbi:hypothetical protein MUK72_16925 (plasmid) [Halococcus dombrowskii]|uniref:Uncharacterized protein n=1 Tax=Halococcus dombrowskii TaxID=179637 RepID=A0AAX3AU60_HALDO|nr:hypothetical protein [Halococcus dombrowskii]UOO97111.1 hypothetical protein MUK72_16925 [Halococcus dombrowskii]